MNGDIESFVTKCEGCGEDVTSYWMKDNTGCVSRPEYVLVADWIFHSECWDKVLSVMSRCPFPSSLFWRSRS